MLVTLGEWQATRAAVAKVNARAAKKGFTGRIEATAERREVTQTGPSGLSVTETRYAVTLTGEPPRYNGWAFVATLEWDRSAGLIVRTVPGVESVDRSTLRDGWCDHCKTERHRTKTYLVRHDDGRQVQVGSTCIKDFTGWRANIIFMSMDDVQDQIGGELARGWVDVHEYPVTTVIAAAWASVEAYGGYIRSGEPGATKDRVFNIIDPPRGNDHWARQAREEARRMQPYVADAMERGATVREWVASDGFSGDNEYVRNLKAIAAAETCTDRNVGMLASAPQAWAKSMERSLIREKEQIINEWVAAPGQRIDIVVTVRKIIPVETAYGMSTLYLLRGEQGHMFKWFASKAALGHVADGTIYTLRATIKEHSEWQGNRQTSLSRCKVLSTMEGTNDTGNDSGNGSGGSVLSGRAAGNG